jgi:UDP-N-acetylglucosamine acyltransferase
VVWPGAVIGTKAQAIKFRGEKTYVNIGQKCEIREYVTINSSTVENSVVEIGDGCFIMAYCHIAHNCTLGKRVIMSNSATLAGFVKVEDGAIIGGFTPLPQHSRIGSYAMVGGMSRVPHDIPPYTIGGGIPFKLGGLNLVGLKRNGFPYETRKVLSQAFKIMYRSGLYLEDALARIRQELPQIPEIQHLLEFCKVSKRGIMGFQGVSEEFEGNNGGDLLEE